MRIQSTSDFDLAELRHWGAEFPERFHVEVDERQAFFKSASAPSWVTLLAEADWWIKVLGAAASIFVAGFISEAGKDTWRNKGKIAKAVLERTRDLALLSAKVLSLQNLRNGSHIDVALPYPNDHFHTSLRLSGASQEIVAAELALFIHHLPRVQALVQKEIKDLGQTVLGAISLTLMDDAALEVTWMTAEEPHAHRHRIDVVTGRGIGRRFQV